LFSPRGASVGEDADDGEEHDRAEGEDGCESQEWVGGVGSGEKHVEGGEPEQGVAGEVDVAPEAAGESAHEDGGGFDGGEEVEGDDAQGDRSRSPGCGVGDEEVGGPEVEVVVGDEPGEMQAGEGDAERAEEAVQVERPSGGAAAGEPGAEEQPGENGGRDERPCNEAAGTGDVPPSLGVHRRVARSWGLAWCRPSSVTTTPWAL
jgi:hypothetical protein